MSRVTWVKTGGRTVGVSFLPPVQQTPTKPRKPFQTSHLPHIDLPPDSTTSDHTTPDRSPPRCLTVKRSPTAPDLATLAVASSTVELLTKSSPGLIPGNEGRCRNQGTQTRVIQLSPDSWSSVEIRGGGGDGDHLEMFLDVTLEDLEKSPNPNDLEKSPVPDVIGYSPDSGILSSNNIPPSRVSIRKSDSEDETTNSASLNSTQDPVLSTPESDQSAPISTTPAVSNPTCKKSRDKHGTMSRPPRPRLDFNRLPRGRNNNTGMLRNGEGEVGSVLGNGVGSVLGLNGGEVGFVDQINVPVGLLTPSPSPERSCPGKSCR
eukprot:sb/3466890/